MTACPRRCAGKCGDLENVITDLDCFQTRRREAAGGGVNFGWLR
jgi:hypothetical protein